MCPDLHLVIRIVLFFMYYVFSSYYHGPFASSMLLHVPAQLLRKYIKAIILLRDFSGVFSNQGFRISQTLDFQRRT